MTAQELMTPRYEVIADFPTNTTPIYGILTCPPYDNDFTVEYWCQNHDKYPHLFRKLNWWDYRKAEDMPKQVICKAIPGDKEVFDIQEWDMDMLVGWVDKGKRECCDLRVFTPEYGYFPVS